MTGLQVALACIVGAFMGAVAALLWVGREGS